MSTRPATVSTAGQRWPGRGLVRVTGALLCDARLTFTTSRPPHALLQLQFAQPGCGLPYVARVDLGAEPADHAAAQALLPQLRTGDWVSVGADALQLQSDHGPAALRLVAPHDVIALGQPRTPTNHTPTPEAAA